ncbi:MAG TPA: primary-amine oxidase [Acidimicrobiales bacterium]
MTDTARRRAHPHDPLTADEVRRAVASVRESGRVPDGTLFVTISVDEPDRAQLAAFAAGEPLERRIRLVLLPGPEAAVVEVAVRMADGSIVEWAPRDDVRPALLYDDAYRSILALKADPAWQAAMGRRGITDYDQVQIDPWPTGNFGRDMEDGRRITRCLSYYREGPSDNGYARPIEGVLATVDAARGEVLEVADFGVVPLATERGSYLPEHNEPHRDDLRALEITQPDGASLTVDGNLLTWQHWTMRVAMTPLEGLVLHEVGWVDRASGATRTVLHRAAISEMVVPYGDPDPMHNWKNAFDVGEWGLGRMANSLTLGCDCLGEITYLDAVFASEHGKPYVLEHAVCIHEEDYGILWKHTDMVTGRAEVRRSRRLVVSSIATVGNYEYGFFWYFYLDGTIQLEVKLTGIMSTKGIPVDGGNSHGTVVAPGLAAPIHQHLFCARLDPAVDGPVNEVHEISFAGEPPGPDNPLGNAIGRRVERLGSEAAARRDVDAASSRHWRLVNPERTNGLGQPVSYKLVPGSTPTLLADPGSSIAGRAGFARHNLWVTPYRADERRAAGDYPNQHAGGAGLPEWTAADRSLVGTEIVVWHTFGVTHSPRPEDWPVMPVEYCGFHLVAAGFFDRNPTLDLPPPDHCH